MMKKITHTGWISEIWKNVQVNIHYTYTASTETNNTSEESPNYSAQIWHPKNDCSLKVVS